MTTTAKIEELQKSVINAINNSCLHPAVVRLVLTGQWLSAAAARLVAALLAQRSVVAAVRAWLVVAVAQRESCRPVRRYSRRRHWRGQ